MKLSDLLINGTRIYHTLSGNRDTDLSITSEDMSPSHWELLMGCSHQGQCDEDAEEAAKYFEIKDYKAAMEWLIECGLERETFLVPYDDEDEDSELVPDEDTILQYYLWDLSGHLQEYNKEDY